MTLVTSSNKVETLEKELSSEKLKKENVGGKGGKSAVKDLEVEMRDLGFKEVEGGHTPLFLSPRYEVD